MSPRGRGARRARGAAPDEKPRNARAAWSRLLTELKPFKWLIFWEFVLIAASTLLGVVIPALLGSATDSILGHKVTQMGQALLLALGFGVGQAVLSYLANRINRTLVQSLAYRLRKSASQKINRLPVSYLDKHDTGDLVSRTTNDVDNVSQTLQQVVGRAFESAISLVGVGAMMIYISPWLAAIIVLSLPVVGVGASAVIKKSQPYFRQQWEQTGKVSTLVEEAFSGQLILSLHGMAPAYAQKFREENNDLAKASFKSQFISMLMQPMMALVSNLTFVIVAVVGALFVVNNMMTIGGVQAFIQYSRTFANPMSTVLQIVNMMQSALASAERLFAFIDEDDSEIEKLSDSVSSPQVVDGESHADIVFEDVTFSYEPGEPIIKHFNLRVKQGQSVAIVGPTGAGKTTLVNLLERYVDPDSGRITLGGRDLRDMPVEELRRQIGMVAQEPWLIDDTISQNIAFGDSDPQEEQVIRAARSSSLDSPVRALPQGYATRVDNDSPVLSAGEKQLLTIARAFYAHRPIVILDEATSAVDTRTELLLAKTMQRLGRGRTNFTIAHRLSTIRGADVIIVMEDGSLVESGSHEDLLAAKGAYYRLYASQFKQV